MRGLEARSRALWLLAAMSMFEGSSPPPVRAASELGIEHVPSDCFLAGAFPVVDAAIASAERLKTAKVYFRAEQFPDYYWVEMQVFEDRFVGVLPKPSAETKRILYYIEAVDLEFYGVRDVGHDPEIRPGCRRSSTTAYVPGDDPSIIVGSTSATGPSVPPGFQAAGIAGFLSAAGLSSGVGGGVGAGSAIIIGAGVAGAAGAAAVAVTGGDEAPPERPDGGPVTSTTSLVPTTTTVGAAVTTTVPAGTSTSTVPSTGTTTVPTTTSSAPSVNACFAYVSRIAPCVHLWSAVCSSGPIVSYDWIVDTTGELPAGPRSFSSVIPTLLVEWNTVGGCFGAPSITVQLRVSDGGSGSDTTTLSGFQISSKQPLDASAVRVRLRSRLSTIDSARSATGHVRVTATRIDPVDGSSAVEHAFEARAGRNVVEATLLSGTLGEAQWEFDFTDEARVVPGSLSASVGDVIALDPRRLVFRLSGRAGQRVRFTYELE